MGFAKSIQSTHSQNFLLTFSVFLLTQDYPLPVSTNLLVHSERSINMGVKNDTVLSLKTEYDPSSSAKTSSSFAEIEFYCKFLQDFSEFRQWDTAKLIFPQTIHPQYCEYFRNNLLRSAGIQTTCVAYDESAHNEETESIKAFAKPNRFKPTEPVVFLHFLTRYEVLYPSFLTQYETSRDVILLTGNVTGDVIMEQFQPSLNFNYKYTIGSGSLDSRTIKIEDIFGFATSAKSVPHFLGFWSPLEGVQIESVKLLGLQNFQGRLIRITSVEGNPVVYLNRNSTTGEVKGRGYLPDILKSLSLFLNFSYVLLEPKDKSFGSDDGSGNWSGMVGMLLRKEAEMALMSFSLTHQRKQVMDFSPPVEYSATRLLIRRDFENTDLKWESFVSPFHWKVWFAIPLTILLGVLTSMVLTQFDLLESTPVTSACLFFCCFLQQGMEGHSYFRKFPSRIVLGSFWILAVVIYASYTARLTSFLAATTDTLPFKSLFEAVQNRNWKIGLVKGSSFRDRVKDSPEPEMKILSKRLDEDASVFVGGFRDGIERVYNEKYIFFTSDLVPSFMVKGNCSYTWIPGKYFPGFGYMGYQKNLPFASAISHRVAQLRESGQMKRLLRKWWGDEASCSKGGDAFAGMSLYETGTAFLIIVLGISLAAFFLSGEFLFQPKPESHDSVQEINVPKADSSDFEGRFPETQLPADLQNHNLNTQFHVINSVLGEVSNLDSDLRSFTFGKSEYSESTLQKNRKDDAPNHLNFLNRNRKLISGTSGIN